MESQSLLHRAAQNLAAIHSGADRPLRSDAVDGVPRQSRGMSQAGRWRRTNRGKQHERVGQGVVDMFVTNVRWQMPKLKTDFFTNQGEHGQKARVVPCELGTRTTDQLAGIAWQVATGIRSLERDLTGTVSRIRQTAPVHGSGLCWKTQTAPASTREHNDYCRTCLPADLCGSKHSEHGSKAHRSRRHGLTSAARSKPRIRTDRFFSEAT